MLYSPSTNGFYDEQIHTNLPADAKEVSNEDYKYLLQGQAQGSIIKPDEAGNPVLVEVVVDQQAIINAESRKYLADTDWYVVRQTETGAPIPQEILDARATARLAIVG